MKPILFKHPETVKTSFFLLNDTGSYFYDTLHYHPLYQLTLIVEGTGTVFIADYIDRFKPGDIFLIGPDLPHVFRCDKEYYSKKNDLSVNGISVYFKYDSFGESFFDLPENSAIRALFKEATLGMKFDDGNSNTFSTQIKSLLKQKGTPKIAAMLLLLDGLAHAEEKVILSSAGFSGTVVKEDNERMKNVFNFLMNHYTETVTLKQVADIACMTTNAFCRFFKKRTQKGLVEFLTEIRIGYACKLLQEENYSVAEISYKSGFNNISNFNRQFKKITKRTPVEYISTLKGG